MRISDWSSDVCSSDLQLQPPKRHHLSTGRCTHGVAWRGRRVHATRRKGATMADRGAPPPVAPPGREATPDAPGDGAASEPIGTEPDAAPGGRKSGLYEKRATVRVSIGGRLRVSKTKQHLELIRI